LRFGQQCCLLKAQLEHALHTKQLAHTVTHIHVNNKTLRPNTAKGRDTTAILCGIKQ